MTQAVAEPDGAPSDSRDAERLAYWQQKLRTLDEDIREKVPERRATGKRQRAGEWAVTGLVAAVPAATGVGLLAQAGVAEAAAAVVLLVTGPAIAFARSLPLSRGTTNLSTALQLEAVAEAAQGGAVEHAKPEDADSARDLYLQLSARRRQIEGERIGGPLSTSTAAG